MELAHRGTKGKRLCRHIRTIPRGRMPRQHRHQHRARRIHPAAIRIHTHTYQTAIHTHRMPTKRGPPRSHPQHRACRKRKRWRSRAFSSAAPWESRWRLFWRWRDLRERMPSALLPRHLHPQNRAVVSTASSHPPSRVTHSSAASPAAARLAPMVVARKHLSPARASPDGDPAWKAHAI